jgi:hypothetical protein
VLLHGPLGYAGAARDLLVRQTARDGLDDLTLPAGERIGALDLLPEPTAATPAREHTTREYGRPIHEGPNGRGLRR